MSIKSINVLQTGVVGVSPRILFLVSTATFAAVTTAGYLNSAKSMGFEFEESDFIFTSYLNGAAILQPSIDANGIITLEASSGEVILPVTSNHIAVFSGTSGTIGDDAATAINGGNLQAGTTTGTAGAVYSCPGTTTTGRLGLSALANAGAFDVVIRNASHAQATVYSIADCGAATGQLLNKTAALVSGNFPQNSGTAGLVIDSGLAVSNVVSKVASNTFSGAGAIVLAKVNGTEAANALTTNGQCGVITTSALTTAAGASYAITWTNSSIATGSVILLSLMGGTNTVKDMQFQATAGAGTSTLTIYNTGPTAALDGTLLIGYTVL